MPIPVDRAPGASAVEFLDAEGKVLHTASITVRDAHFPSQNVVMGKALQELKASPEEAALVSTFTHTVSDQRLWAEPFGRPVPGCMTSPYGVHRLHNGKPTGNYHLGLDQRAAAGTPIRTITGGTVKLARTLTLQGSMVGVDHGQGVTSVYMHMSKFAVAEGTQVKAGDVVGYVGSSGRSTGPHLHWGVQVNGIPVNPAQWMKFERCGAPKR